MESDNLKELIGRKIISLIRITSALFILQITCYTHKAYGQYEDFKTLADSETVQLFLGFHGDFVGIQFLNLPKEIIVCGLVIKNLNETCFGGNKIEGRQFSVKLNGNYSIADTFIIYLASYNFELQYPAEVFLLSNLKNKIAIGADCFKLNCIPKNDPWMPTAYDPFLFLKYGFYINPANGKIKKGARLIRSGNYSICDLKKMKYINPYGLYLDKIGNKYRGIDLIDKGKIKLSDWNLENFILQWYQ